MLARNFSEHVLQRPDREVAVAEIAPEAGRIS